MFLPVVDDDFGIGDQERHFSIQLNISHSRFDVCLRGIDRCGMHAYHGFLSKRKVRKKNPERQVQKETPHCCGASKVF